MVGLCSFKDMITRIDTIQPDRVWDLNNSLRVIFNLFGF